MAPSLSCQNYNQFYVKAIVKTFRHQESEVSFGSLCLPATATWMSVRSSLHVFQEGMLERPKCLNLQTEYSRIFYTLPASTLIPYHGKGGKCRWQ